MNRPRLILAEDHRIVAEGLRRLLESEFDILGLAVNGEELLDLVAREDPDLVLLDITMPKLNGIQALKRMREKGMGPRVVVLSMHSDEAYVRAALAEGAMGYVLKRGDPDEIATALHEALAGRPYLSPGIPRKVLEPSAGGSPTVADLTGRQQEIMDLVVQGRSMKQIAHELGISIKTVEYHKYRVMERLEVQTTAELIHLLVRQEGYAPPAEGPGGSD